MAKLFGTNGIRGIFGDDLTLQFIHEITRAISKFFKKGTILVGYDGRNSSPLIVKIICSTLNYSGLDCKNIGLVPTPCIEYVTKNQKYSGAIMVTASHNPPKYNGIKPIASDGVEISREDENEIENIYFNKMWNHEKIWGHTQHENSAIQIYIDGIKSQINVSKIKDKNFKIVLDLGNGAQAVTAPRLCEEFGCIIILINEKIDGSFPGRGSEPTPENISELSNVIKKNKADLGVAFDGDGDRSIFCDNEGNILTGDQSALLLSQYLLEKKPKSTIVTCLNSGTSIETIAKKFGASVIRTKVGSVEVSRKMVQKNAFIGYEENGGFMYGLHNQVRDGAMTLALMLDLLANTDKKMSELVRNLPPSFTTKTKISCTEEESNKIIAKLKNEYPNSDTTDGIKITFDEQTWLMVRQSGTEPIIRVYAEANSKENLDKLLFEHLQKIESIKVR